MRRSCKSVLHVHVCLLGLPLRSDATPVRTRSTGRVGRGAWRFVVAATRGVTVAQRFALTFVSPNLSQGVTSPPAQAKQSGSLAVAVAPVPVPLAWREAGH